MKILLTYSSKTGNTQKVAEAISQILPPGRIFINLSQTPQPDFSDFDLIIVGTWIDKGTADPKALNFIKTVNNKKTAFFYTLGAKPDSPHATDCTENIRNLFLENKNELLGHFFCQGALDPKLVEMFKKFPPDHPHALTPEKRGTLSFSRPAPG